LSNLIVCSFFCEKAQSLKSIPPFGENSPNLVTLKGIGPFFDSSDLASQAQSNNFVVKKTFVVFVYPQVIFKLPKQFKKL
jgi:hypothetical protein